MSWQPNMPEVFGNHHTAHTEAQLRFAPPPQNARPAASCSSKGKTCSFPKETYPSDFRTTTQLSFGDVARLQGKHRQTPFRPSDSGSFANQLEAADVMQTTNGLAQKLDPAQMAAMKARARSGNPSQHPLHCDIINGSDLGQVRHNKYERWTSQQDYQKRRTR